VSDATFSEEYDIIKAQECLPMLPTDDTKEMAQAIAAECVGVRVRMLNRIVTRIYDDALRSHGLKVSQMNILTVVALRGPIQPAQIVRILSIEKSTLSRNVQLMEANGWIESLSGDGGHTHLLRLTQQGRQLYKKAAPGWQAAQEKLTNLLGDQTTSTIRRAVDQVRETESAA
jgi:DNA-binding MarR family transcriptional regulator